MKIHEIEELCKIYGPDFTLGELLNNRKGNYIYECPKCEGRGTIVKEENKRYHPYNEFPLLFDENSKHIVINCNLCNGEGYTKHKYVTKMIQIPSGWEIGE